jgi:hypothetical protein
MARRGKATCDLVGSSGERGQGGEPKVSLKLEGDRKMRDLQEKQDHLVEVINRCVELGMKLPFIVCAVSPNGSVLAMRVNGGGRESDLLAKHFENQTFMPPLNIMVLDQNGEAVRVVIDGKEVSYH